MPISSSICCANSARPRRGACAERRCCECHAAGRSPWAACSSHRKASVALIIICAYIQMSVPGFHSRCPPPTFQLSVVNSSTAPRTELAATPECAGAIPLGGGVRPACTLIICYLNHKLGAHAFGPARCRWNQPSGDQQGVERRLGILRSRKWPQVGREASRGFSLSTPFHLNITE